MSYLPVLQQALRDVSAWVETGAPPPANSSYQVSDGQVVLAATAPERKGIQPVLTVRIRRTSKAIVEQSKQFEVIADVEVPPGTGKIVAAWWDFDGSGTFIPAKLKASPKGKLKIRTRWSYGKPGTYFPTPKVESVRDGNADSPYARIPNLGRVRFEVVASGAPTKTMAAD